MSPEPEEKTGRQPVGGLHILAVFVRRIEWVILSALMGAGLMTIAWFVLGPSFAATSTFAVQSSNQDLSRFSGLASQFGLSLPSMSFGESVDYFAEVLRAPSFLSRIVEYEYDVTRDEGAWRGTLIDYYETEGQTDSERLRSAISRLLGDVSISTNSAAGTVAITTSAPSEELAVQINQRMLVELARYNTETRQTTARNETAFLTERLSEARSELLESEVEFQRFLEQNRTYQNSPQLAFEANRLQRRLELQQDVYTGLAQAFERARLEEVRNTPAITILDNSEDFVVPAGPSLPLLLALGGILGGLLSVAVIYLGDYLREQQQRNAPEYEEFIDALRHRGRRSD